MNIELNRFKSLDSGTFGKLTVNNLFQFYTVEKPWDNNLPFNSCIASGEYSLIPHKSNKYGECLAVVNEDLGVTHWKEPHSKRYAILIHPANFSKDVLGCIGLGDHYTNDMVTNSRQAVKDFYNMVDPNEVHSLVINWKEQ